MQAFKTFVSFLVLAFVAQSLFAQKDKGFNFPPDFGKTETTVVIGEGSKDKITEAMINAFEKEFTGKFVAQADIPAKSKSDTIYRYVFFVMEEFQPGYTVGRDRYPSTYNYRFGLMDRQTGKRYPTEYLSGAYGKGAKYYVKNLEKFRKANGGL